MLCHFPQTAMGTNKQQTENLKMHFSCHKSNNGKKIDSQQNLLQIGEIPSIQSNFFFALHLKKHFKSREKTKEFSAA